MNNILSTINGALQRDAVGFVADCEMQFAEQLRQTADELAKQSDLRVIALAGPSSSGKTTTAHRLAKELTARGRTAAVISLDDFFLPPEQAPRLPDGGPDFEAVSALDLPQMRRCFAELLETGKTDMPRFDFRKKRPSGQTRPLSLETQGLLIAEGLHALHPLVSETVPPENRCGLAVAVQSDLRSDDGQTVLSGSDIRLARRLLRDAIFRNSGPRETLVIWSSVIRGEERYLRAFLPLADRTLDSFHPYELAVYRKRLCQMAATVPEGVPNYLSFCRIVAAAERMLPLSETAVPPDSLLREFIGGTGSPL